MRIRCRPSWVLVALGLTFAACGAAEPNRFDQHTPGANTGDPNVTPLPTLSPTPKATATAKPTAKATATPSATPARKPVTRAEKRVIKGWSDELRHGRVTAASRYFSVPVLVLNATPDPVFLNTPDAVKEFNRGLPCGAKLIRTRRSTDKFVVGIFRLTERPGAGECGTGTGAIAAVAFLIEKRHITYWVRVEDPNNPTPTVTPTPSPGASATETPTPTGTPTATPTEAPKGVPGLA